MNKPWCKIIVELNRKRVYVLSYYLLAFYGVKKQKNQWFEIKFYKYAFSTEFSRTY